MTTEKVLFSVVNDNNNYDNMAHISTYKDAQSACIIITPALAPAT